MKTQIIIVHGGTTFESFDDYIQYLKTLPVSLEYLKKESWKDSLQESLGDGFDVVRLQMPNKTFAHYEEWKIYFERYIPLFGEDVVLIGHSLGGIFLAKYLSENTFPKKVKSLYLIAAPHSEVQIPESLGDFVLPESLDKISNQIERIFILFSEDDPLVSGPHAEKYKNQLPHAEVIKFMDKKHFSQGQFPELADHIKNNP